MGVKHSEIWSRPGTDNQNDQADVNNRGGVTENSDFMKISQDSFDPFSKNGDFMFETQKCDFSELQ